MVNAQLIFFLRFVNLNNKLAKNMFKKSSALRLFFCLFIILLIVILLSAFYWFEYRPAKIRQECSWVIQHQEATPYIPAVPEKSKEQLIAEGVYQDCSSQSGALLKTFCEHKNRSFEAGSPAIPAKEAKSWYDKATAQEYEFCIKSKGLNK